MTTSSNVRPDRTPATIATLVPPAVPTQKDDARSLLGKDYNLQPLDVDPLDHYVTVPDAGARFHVI